MCECNVNVSSLVHNIETHACLDPSHTRASMIDIINIIRKHTQMHIRHGNYFLLVYLWQGVAIGLDVTCPTRVRSQTNINHSRIRIKNVEVLNISSKQFISGSRGLQRPSKVFGQRLQSM